MASLSPVSSICGSMEDKVSRRRRLTNAFSHLRRLCSRLFSCNFNRRSSVGSDSSSTTDEVIVKRDGHPCSVPSKKAPVGGSFNYMPKQVAVSSNKNMCLCCTIDVDSLYRDEIVSCRRSVSLCSINRQNVFNCSDTRTNISVCSLSRSVMSPCSFRRNIFSCNIRRENLACSFNRRYVTSCGTCKRNAFSFATDSTRKLNSLPQRRNIVRQKCKRLNCRCQKRKMFGYYPQLKTILEVSGEDVPEASTGKHAKLEEEWKGKFSEE